MRTAADLLGSARSLEGLTAVLRAVGFSEPVELPGGVRDFGLVAVRPHALFAGVGAVRALLVRTRPGFTVRDAIQRSARRLATRSPHVVWLIAALDESGAQAGIAAWTPTPSGPRLASLLWEPDGVVDSDAETLCALAAVTAADDALFHARCMEVLGRDALTRRFYRTLEGRVRALAAECPPVLPPETARGVALLYVSRLLFLHFLEAKGWLNGDRAFLVERFDECMRTGGGFHRRVLLPLFFGTLNTPWSKRARAARAFGAVPFLNGGLFARTPLERRAAGLRLPDPVLGDLFEQLFQRFRFVAREDSATWSEASVDPEMLGRAFESLMASSERKAGGVFYTPHQLVERVSEHALLGAARPSLESLRRLRVLDPACGSGAFLVYALDRLATLRRDAGDPASASAIRRDVLSRSIFGVDRNPTAVWLCELRLWLAVVIESEERDPARVPPLPNLDRNIRVGDALVGHAFASGAAAVVGGSAVDEIRARYVRATGARKQSLARRLDREERRRVLAHTDREILAARHARAERLGALRARDLFGERVAAPADTKRELRALRERLRALRGERRRVEDGGALPFSFHAFFANAQAQGGFDVVLGNPPWVRLHRIPGALRLHLKRAYEVYRSAPWQAGAASGRASPGFAAQVDLAALFVERGVALLRDGGILSLLLPAKLWRSLAGGGVRQLLLRRTRVIRLEDLTDSKHAFDAAVYPSLLVARVSEARVDEACVASARSPVRLAVAHRDGSSEWAIACANLPFDASPGAPWMLLSPSARAAFDRVRAAGIRLSASSLGAPRLGVKSGCNAAFVVRVTDTGRDLASVVDADGETGTVDLALLRPALRGDAVTPWRRLACNEWIVWTHDARGAPLQRLPERTRVWLRRRYGDLARRTDAAHARRWWSLFRVDAADSSTARVVWADFGRRPRAAVLEADDPTVPLNSCYVLRCADASDAWAVAALLNSPLAAAWLNAIAEPARGGYRRYLGWTVGLLPIPRNWPAARALLLGARDGDDETVLTAALRAYGLDRAHVAPLLEWQR